MWSNYKLLYKQQHSEHRPPYDRHDQVLLYVVVNICIICNCSYCPCNSKIYVSMSLFTVDSVITIMHRQFVWHCDPVTAGVVLWSRFDHMLVYLTTRPTWFVVYGYFFLQLCYDMYAHFFLVKRLLILVAGMRASWQWNVIKGWQYIAYNFFNETHYRMFSSGYGKRLYCSLPPPPPPNKIKK